jgi:hypothetical protein
MRKWSQLSAAGSPKQVTEVEMFLDKSRKSFFGGGQVEFTSISKKSTTLVIQSFTIAL